MAWKYERTEQEFKKMPVGRYRLRIADAFMGVSKSSGNDMITMVIQVSGQNKTIRNYVPFIPDKPEITNRNLTAIFDSFGLEEGNFDYQNWIGRMGAGNIKIDDDGYEKIGYFINKDKQDALPAWIEPERGYESSYSGGGSGEVPYDGELPF